MTDGQQRRRRIFGGAVGHAGPAVWVEHQLIMEELGEHQLDGSPTQPVSVRLDCTTIAILDALAARFRITRSAFLARVVQGGVSEAFQALGDAEQDAMLAALRGKVRVADLVYDPDGVADANGPNADPRAPDTPLGSDAGESRS